MAWDPKEGEQIEQNPNNDKYDPEKGLSSLESSSGDKKSGSKKSGK